MGILFPRLMSHTPIKVQTQVRCGFSS